MLEVCKLLGVRKLNTSGYHTETDGLVEKFNDMIANSSETYPFDWDITASFVCLLHLFSKDNKRVLLCAWS